MAEMMWATPAEETLTKYDGQLCSLIAAAQGEDMIGLATQLHTRLLFEAPPPWPSSFREMRPHGAAIGEILMRAYERGEKTYGGAIMTDAAYSVQGMRRVLVWRRPAAPFARFERTEYLVPERDMVALALALIEQPDHLPRFADYQVFDTPTRDVVVCTHGAVEASCAKFGFPIYKALRETIDRDAPGSARVWRGTHIGGCRMAATLFELPEGRYWGHVPPDLVRLVALRDAPPAPLYRHYRGWSGLGYFEQIVEREALMATGWDWTGYWVTGCVLWVDGEVPPDAYPPTMPDAPRAVGVRLDYTTPDGDCGAYEATVEHQHTLETVNSTKTRRWFKVNQYRVTRLTHVSSIELALLETSV